MIQQDLFSDQPVQAHSETSREAGEQAKPIAAKLREQVYEFLRSNTCGCTDEEIQIGLGMNPNTQRPRRIELVRAGLVRDSGIKRKTNSGRDAVVWEVAR